MPRRRGDQDSSRAAQKDAPNVELAAVADSAKETTKTSKTKPIVKKSKKPIRSHQRSYSSIEQRERLTDFIDTQESFNKNLLVEITSLRSEIESLKELLSQKPNTL
jgi:hypothetical protein